MFMHKPKVSQLNQPTIYTIQELQIQSIHKQKLNSDWYNTEFIKYKNNRFNN